MATTVGNATDAQKKESFAPASKFIELVEYDEASKTMEVTFKSGSKHRYLMVFPSTFMSFKKSPTHDAYYSRAIRGNLPSVKIIDANIGRKESSPLKAVKKEQHLDRGLREQIARSERTAGTVARAFNAATTAA